jgi:pyruvate/2-oxoglutarate dehydrogenase complex dihydrolipoamide acyltransferase (E2) component
MDITMPKMGESVMEGTIIKWYKKVGDRLMKDEPLFEISTDKVDTEIPSPAEGTLAEIMVGEQETVDVDTVVARIDTNNPHVTRSGKTEPSVNEASKAKPAGSENPQASSGIKPLVTKHLEPSAVKPSEADTPRSESSLQPASMHDNFASTIPAPEVQEEIGFLSPLVLNIAKTEKIGYEELKNIKGTGQQGRISKKDILTYVEKKKQQNLKPERMASTQSKPVYSSLKETVIPSGDVEVIPMDNIRQKIMQHMINSRDTSVHVTALIEVDMLKIHTFIQNHKNDFMEKEGIKLTYMPFIADAAIKALKEYPLVNSTIDGTTIYKKKFINLGIAVAMEPNGLIVPNIKKAGEKNFIGIAKSINELAVNARTKKLTPDDISQGTFTITNYGVFGTIFGTPIINQPEVAILGVGAIIKKPIAVAIDGNDSISIRPVMALTLAHDHRIIDGMLGGKFLKFVKDILESFEPDSL